MGNTVRIVSVILVSVGMCFSQVASEGAPNDSIKDAGRWELDFSTNALLTVNTYSNNWAGSEEGTVTWISQLNMTAKKKLNPWLQNQNKFKLAFGETYVQDSDEERWSAPQKTTDLIDLESRLHFTLGKYIDPFASVRMISQFWDRNDTLDDLYVNPIELTESFGGAIDILKKEATSWTVRLGGALRQKIDRDVVGDDYLFTNRGGVDLNSDFVTTALNGVIEFNSLLAVYQAVVRLSEVDDDNNGLIREQYWYYPDVNWENTITVNIAKYIMLNAYVQVLYDKEIISDVRFKETFSFGLTYKFIRPKKAG